MAAAAQHVDRNHAIEFFHPCARRVGGGDLREQELAQPDGSDVDADPPQMTLARDEVFGPILSIIPFDDEVEALKIANATSYGLASAVWTGNLSRAHRMIRGIQAGVVHVNTYGGADGTVPLGGVKQSGNGHDKSLHAFDKYTDLKTAWIQL